MTLKSLIQESRTLELAIQRDTSLVVELKKIDQNSQDHWGINLDGMMTFKSGFSETELFLDIVKGKYVTTTRGNITAMLGNGMSGNATLFFNYSAVDDVKKILKTDKITVDGKSITWQPESK